MFVGLEIARRAPVRDRVLEHILGRLDEEALVEGLAGRGRREAAFPERRELSPEREELEARRVDVGLPATGFAHSCEEVGDLNFPLSSSGTTSSRVSLGVVSVFIANVVRCASA